MPPETEIKYGPSPGVLCLFESFQGGVESDAPIYSEFSLFVSLLHVLNQDGRNTSLIEKLGISDPEETYSFEIWDKSVDYIEVFHNDPVGTLKKLGCRPAIGRKIEVLYKIRETDLDYLTHYKTDSLFGYPIYIAAA